MLLSPHLLSKNARLTLSRAWSFLLSWRKMYVPSLSDYSTTGRQSLTCFRSTSFIHASPGRVFDTGLTNNIEEQVRQRPSQRHAFSELDG